MLGQRRRRWTNIESTLGHPTGMHANSMSMEAIVLSLIKHVTDSYNVILREDTALS